MHTYSVLKYLRAPPRSATPRPARGSACRRAHLHPPPPPPPSRTNWTRLVPPSVLTGHVSHLHQSSKSIQNIPSLAGT